MDEFTGIEVLLVEDNDHDAEQTMRAFKDCKFSHKLYWVKDGDEALDFIAGFGRL